MVAYLQSLKYFFRNLSVVLTTLKFTQKRTDCEVSLSPCFQDSPQIFQPAQLSHHNIIFT